MRLGIQKKQLIRKKWIGKWRCPRWTSGCQEIGQVILL